MCVSANLNCFSTREILLIDFSFIKLLFWNLNTKGRRCRWLKHGLGNRKELIDAYEWIRPYWISGFRGFTWRDQQCASCLKHFLCFFFNYLHDTKRKQQNNFSVNNRERSVYNVTHSQSCPILHVSLLLWGKWKNQQIVNLQSASAFKCVCTKHVKF